MATMPKSSAKKTTRRVAPKVKTVRRTSKKATEAAVLAKRAGAVEVTEIAPIAVVEIVTGLVTVADAPELTAMQMLNALVDEVEPGQVAPIKAAHLAAAFGSLVTVLVEEKTEPARVDHIAVQGSKKSRRKQRRELAKKAVIVDRLGRAAGRPVRNEYHAAHRARYWGEQRQIRAVDPFRLADAMASAIVESVAKKNSKPAIAVPEMDEGDGRNIFHLSTPNPKRRQKGGKASTFGAGTKDKTWQPPGDDPRESLYKPCLVPGCKGTSRKSFEARDVKGMEGANGKDVCRWHGEMLIDISRSGLDVPTRAMLVSALLDHGQEPDEKTLAAAAPAEKHYAKPLPAHAVTTVPSNGNGNAQVMSKVACKFCSAPAKFASWKFGKPENVRAELLELANGQPVCESCGAGLFHLGGNDKVPQDKQPVDVAGVIAWAAKAKEHFAKRGGNNAPAPKPLIAHMEPREYLRVVTGEQHVEPAPAQAAAAAEKDLCPLCQLRESDGPGKLCEICLNAPVDGQKIDVRCTECGGTASHYKHFVQEHRGSHKPIWCEACKAEKFGKKPAQKPAQDANAFEAAVSRAEMALADEPTGAPEMA